MSSALNYCETKVAARREATRIDESFGIENKRLDDGRSDEPEIENQEHQELFLPGIIIVTSFFSSQLLKTMICIHDSHKLSHDC